MKKYAVRRHYSYFETNSEEVNKGVFDEKLESFDQEFKALLEKYDLSFISNDTRFIAVPKMSATKCEKCGNLMINRDKNPCGFNKEDLWADLDTDYNCIVWDGGTHENKELCMECLPIEHRWGFFS